MAIMIVFCVPTVYQSGNWPTIYRSIYRSSFSFDFLHFFFCDPFIALFVDYFCFLFLAKCLNRLSFSDSDRKRTKKSDTLPVQTVYTNDMHSAWIYLCRYKCNGEKLMVVAHITKHLIIHCVYVQCSYTIANHIFYLHTREKRTMNKTKKRKD